MLTSTNINSLIYILLNAQAILRYFFSAGYGYTIYDVVGYFVGTTIVLTMPQQFDLLRRQTECNIKRSFISAGLSLIFFWIGFVILEMVTHLVISNKNIAELIMATIGSIMVYTILRRDTNVIPNHTASTS